MHSDFLIPIFKIRLIALFCKEIDSVEFTVVYYPNYLVTSES